MAQSCFCLTLIQRKQRPQLASPTVTCSSRRIKAVFGPLVKNNLHGYKVVVPLLVQLTGGNQWIRVNISCPLIKRSSQMNQPTPSFGDCDADKNSLRIDCGHRSITSMACVKLGCCYDADASACYYRLNACSLDGHFVFTVKATDTDPPIDPSSLVIKDQPHCLPVVSTSDTALFKMGVTDCGAKIKKVGDLVTYEVEVVELKTKRKRRSPFSLQVECVYEESDFKLAKELRSLYAVTNPPAVVAKGTIRAQMRLATDATFTAFVPEDQLPLKLPLGEKVNVEISIVPPFSDPTLSLRVLDCFAYPVSKHSVWTLLHDGCPNPLDKRRSSVPLDQLQNNKTHSLVRRFDVKTFAFLDPSTGKRSAEKMYFYCWVEICTEDLDCSQPCSMTSSNPERRRRRTTSASIPGQLVSLGPLQLVENDPEQDDVQFKKLSKAIRGMVYVLCGVGALLLVILLFALRSNSQRCKRGKITSSL
ncbi:PREDICTED: zona pellucida sperm-binding protein 4-like [Cyprinodon variegatus]|uniref:zona pellucida sperm-binding protein 4-like n=1 Tax=Cyprinodon variegatus TaxID=28743 RepID=UPI000742BA88|nr:PREDICTED: zona pellucida sperm-binding protein 4-like [Cyprinodon variegatus]